MSESERGIDYEAPLEPRDYATARRIVVSDYSDQKRELEIMAALSSERARARAPFLRLLERLDKPSGHIGRDREAVTWMADHLRAAAQEQP